MKYNHKEWTYGAELELSDLDQRKGLPEGFDWDRRDVTMVNSNGIAVDPKGKLYPFGGEINTPPTASIREQVEKFEEVLAFHENATVNHRSNLHIHIRVPGLKKDLESLKAISAYVHKHPEYLELLEPIPVPVHSDYDSEAEFNGAHRRFRRRKVSHHKLLNKKQLAEQQKATTIEEFFAAEAPKKKDGTPMFHLAPRCAVNLRQLNETDTIEFRHFPGTLDPDKFKACLQFCRDFLKAALSKDGPSSVDIIKNGQYDIPKFKKYVHWREVLYRNTVHDGTLPKEVIAKNIKKIRSGEWDKENLPLDPSLKTPIISKKTNRVVRIQEFKLDEVKPGKKLSDYQEGSPWVTFIRGASGTGKSTIIYNLLLRKENEFRTIDPKAGVVKYGYFSKKLNCFIVGGYETACGGCDSVKSVDEMMARIKRAVKKGYNVIAEGLIVSGMTRFAMEASEYAPVYTETLDTDLATLLGRIARRRASRGEFDELHPENTVKKYNSSISTTRGGAKYTVGVGYGSNKKVYYRILKRLGIEKQKFDPNIYENMKGTQK